MNIGHKFLFVLLIVLAWNCQTVEQQKEEVTSKKYADEIQQRIESVEGLKLVSVKKSNKKIIVTIKDSISHFHHAIALKQLFLYCVQDLIVSNHSKNDTLELICHMPLRRRDSVFLVGKGLFKYFNTYTSIFKDSCSKSIINQIFNSGISRSSSYPYGFLSELNLRADSLLFANGLIDERDFFGVEIFKVIDLSCRECGKEYSNFKSLWSELLNEYQLSGNVKFVSNYMDLKNAVLKECPTDSVSILNRP